MKKPSSTVLATIIICATLLLITGGIGAIYLHNQALQKKAQQEQAAQQSGQIDCSQYMYFLHDTSSPCDPQYNPNSIPLSN